MLVDAVPAMSMQPTAAGVCKHAVTPQYTGRRGKLYIPITPSRRGWGNVCTNLFQSLVLALLLDRRPVLVSPENDKGAQFLKYFAPTDRIDFESDMPGDMVHIPQVAARVRALVHAPPPANVPVKTFDAWGVRGLDLIRAARRRGLLSDSACIAPFFLLPRTQLVTAARAAAAGSTAVHVRTCRAAHGNWSDTCIRQHRTQVNNISAAARNIVSLAEHTGSSSRLFVAADDEATFARVRKLWARGSVQSFEGLGRVVHSQYPPSDRRALVDDDLRRILSDWLAPVYANEVIEIGGSTFWLSSLCLFRPAQRMMVLPAAAAMDPSGKPRQGASMTWSCATDGLVPLHWASGNGGGRGYLSQRLHVARG